MSPIITPLPSLLVPPLSRGTIGRGTEVVPQRVVTMKMMKGGVALTTPNNYNRLFHWLITVIY